MKTSFTNYEIECYNKFLHEFLKEECHYLFSDDLNITDYTFKDFYESYIFSCYENGFQLDFSNYESKEKIFDYYNIYILPKIIYFLQKYDNVSENLIKLDCNELF